MCSLKKAAIEGVCFVAATEGWMQFKKNLDESVHDGDKLFVIILYGSFNGLKDVAINRTGCVNARGLCFNHEALGA